jgi:hypothetical protein
LQNVSEDDDKLIAACSGKAEKFFLTDDFGLIHVLSDDASCRLDSIVRLLPGLLPGAIKGTLAQLPLTIHEKQQALVWNNSCLLRAVLYHLIAEYAAVTPNDMWASSTDGLQ